MNGLLPTEVSDLPLFSRRGQSAATHQCSELLGSIRNATRVIQQTTEAIFSSNPVILTHFVVPRHCLGLCISIHRGALISIFKRQGRRVFSATIMDTVDILERGHVLTLLKAIPGILVLFHFPLSLPPFSPLSSMCLAETFNWTRTPPRPATAKRTSKGSLHSLRSRGPLSYLRRTLLHYVDVRDMFKSDNLRRFASDH